MVVDSMFPSRLTLILLWYHHLLKLLKFAPYEALYTLITRIHKQRHARPHLPISSIDIDRITPSQKIVLKLLD